MGYRLFGIAFLAVVVQLNLASPVFSQQQSESQPEPESWFDFWVGEWDVRWDEQDGQTGKGTNTIEKILDGRVIQEHFRITEGRMSGFKGTSLSVYQSRFNRWKQAWADNNGGYFDFTGRRDGDNRIFQTGLTEREDGTVFTQRMVFYDITENSMTWDWESSTDGGQTWTLNWRIYYTRK